jgi:hypothetical protein
LDSRSQSSLTVATKRTRSSSCESLARSTALYWLESLHSLHETHKKIIDWFFGEYWYPWYFLVVPFVLSFVFISVGSLTSYFIVLYGLKFNEQTKGDQFSKSNALSMVEDIFIKSPGQLLFKIILYAALLSVLEHIFFPVRRLSAKQLRQIKKQEEEANEYISDFVARIIHNVNRKHDEARTVNIVSPTANATTGYEQLRRQSYALTYHGPSCTDAYKSMVSSWMNDIDAAREAVVASSCLETPVAQSIPVRPPVPSLCTPDPKPPTTPKALSFHRSFRSLS